MSSLTNVKKGVVTWVGGLSTANSFKLAIGLITSVLYLLSATFPALGQWLLCGILAVIGFTSSASIMLSLAGVSINKLAPIEDLFETLQKKWEGTQDDGPK